MKCRRLTNHPQAEKPYPITAVRLRDCVVRYSNDPAEMSRWGLSCRVRLLKGVVPMRPREQEPTRGVNKSLMQHKRLANARQALQSHSPRVRAQ